MKTITNQYILVNTDFSKTGTIAVLHGIKLSILLNKNLYLININNKKIGENKNKLKIISENIHNEYNIEVAYDIIPGKPEKLNEIKSIASGLKKNIDPLLIIIGINNNIKGLLKLIKISKTPIISIQNKNLTKDFYNNIIVPMDFLKEAKEKLLWAIYFGKNIGSTIHFLFAEEKDEYLHQKSEDNLMFTKKTLSNYPNIKYKIHKINRGKKSIDECALIFTKEEIPGLIIIMRNKNYIFSRPEKKIILNNEKTSIMCLNRNENFYVPCI
ncbi:MAG: hypothetical protein DRJ01_07895 [Bacteroidetes bacterium]|nr:MAG: hypothetical protein DRJ01_07895 [Bacteroidota bacterium]